MQYHRLSSVERAFWADELLSGAHNYLYVSFLLDGSHRIDLLQQSLRLLIDENPQYHSTIELRNGVPFWATAEATIYPFDEVVYDGDEITVVERDFASQVFDLSTDYPCRFRFLRWCGKTLFMALFHHIVTEVKSVQLFTSRLSDIYNTLMSHHQLIPKPSRIFEFADSLPPSRPEDIAYWNEYAARHQAEILLPYFPESLSAGRITQYHFSLGEFKERILETCRIKSLGRFRLLSAACAVTMHKIFSVEHLCLNYSVSHRSDEHAETIGVFVGNLLHFVDVSPEATFIKLVEDVVRNRRAAQSHEKVSIIETEMAKTVRDSHATVAFNFPLNRQEQQLELSGEVIPLFHAFPTAMPSALQIDIEGSLSSGIVYCNKEYPAFFAETLAKCFLKVVAQIMDDIEIPIKSIVIADQTDTFNQEMQVDAARRPPLAASFSSIASKYAMRPAVLFGDNMLTYEQLDRYSDVIASLILQHTQRCQPSDFIGVYVSRSLFTVAFFLGVWKAGYAYVPIDPNNTSERLQQIVSDCSPSFLLTDLDSVPGFEGDDVLHLNPEMLQQPSPPLPSCLPNKYAYMIYTSGTTGRPKGTPITQRALQNLIDARQEYIPKSENTLEMSFASISFDASVWDVFPPLLTGTTIYYISEEERHDPQLILDALARRQVTCACIPPAILTLLPYQPMPQLKYLVIAGESCPVETIRKWQATCKVVNAYGPTENTVCTTMHVYGENPVAINIGQPLQNVSCYVLDAHNYLLPPGVRGRLFIGGQQLTEGYYHREQLNEESFIPNPFATTRERALGLNDRLYDSGDNVCQLPDGDLLFFGRSDQQVKISGHRVELGEVQSRIEQYPGVKSVVVKTTKRQGRNVISAYIEADSESFDLTGLRQTISQQLPHYMMPSSITLVEQMPLTINRKIDFKALEQLPASSLIKESDPLPDTSIYTTILQVWQQVLDTNDTFSLDDNFLDLGGDSIALIMMVQTLEKRLGVSIPMAEVYQSPTIRHLAQLIEHSSALQSESSTSFSPTINSNIPPHLLSLLMECLMSPQASRAYHLVQLIPIDGNPSIDVLTEAWNRMRQRQESLRLTFTINREGRPEMSILPFQPETILQQVNYRDDNHLEQLVKQRLNDSYTFDGSPLCRAVVYVSENNPTVVAVYIHHLLTDGWSMRLLREQFTDICRQLQSGSSSEPLVPLTYGYSDYVHSLLTKDVLKTDKDYWEQYLSGIEDLHLPYTSMPKHDEYLADLLTVELSQKQSEGIVRYCREHRLTPFAFLVSAFMLMLARLCRQEDFVVGYPSSGRTDSRFSQVIGYFVHPLPLRFTGDCWSLSFEDYCRQILHDVRNAEEHLMAFSQLVEIANSQGITEASCPLVQAMFAFENYSRESLLALQAPAQFPLSLTVSRKTNASWICTWKYAVSRLQVDTVRLMSRCFGVLVEHILQNDSPSISGLSMLSVEGRKAIIRRNTISPLTVPEQNVVTMFRQMVAQPPHPWMAKDQDSTWTYQQFDHYSDMVAAALPHHAHNLPVGMLMERSCRAIATILGIMKAGHIYVPLSASYPVERLRSIIGDCQMCCIVYDRSLQNLAEDLALSANIQRICFDDCLSVNLSQTPPLPVISGSDIAYMIYTSGTTGQPKGVAVTHSNLAALVSIGSRDLYNISEDDIVLQYNAYVFDASINDLFPALLSGARLVVASDVVRHDVRLLMGLIEHEHITYTSIPPALLPLCPDHLPATLRTLVVGGETSSQAAIERYSHQLTMLNEYGPSENTVTTTVHQFGADDIIDARCIGRQLQGVSCYVLDDHLNLLPLGCPGQLYIGGLQLSAGYNNRPQLNEDCFIPNPYVSSEDECQGLNTRIYSTGDIVRQDEHGNFYFIERKDMQVKIRGFRIELQDIEQTLLRHPAVSQCVANVRTIGGTPQLVAFVVSSQDDLQSKELHDYLSTLLPSYMLPSYWSILPAFPLTPNGKIDYRRLPAPQHYATTVKSERPTMSEIERRLCAIVERLLEIETGTIRPEDDLFNDLGMTSIQVLQTAQALKDVGIVISPSDIFLHRTISALARLGQSCSSGWYKGYDAAKPVVVLVCGYTPAHPFYSDYLEILHRDFSVWVFDSFLFWNEGSSDAVSYVNYLLIETDREMNRVGAKVYAVTGHSIGSALGLLLAERLRQRGNPDIRMVAIGTSLHVNSRTLDFIGDSDMPLKQMQASMPPLHFEGDLRVALEQKPVASVVLNGEPNPEFEKLSQTHIVQNEQLWKRTYPSAKFLMLDASHFEMLQPRFLPLLAELMGRKTD